MQTQLTTFLACNLNYSSYTSMPILILLLGLHTVNVESRNEVATTNLLDCQSFSADFTKTALIVTSRHGSRYPTLFEVTIEHLAIGKYPAASTARLIKLGAGSIFALSGRRLLPCSSFISQYSAPQNVHLVDEPANRLCKLPNLRPPQ